MLISSYAYIFIHITYIRVYIRTYAIKGREGKFSLRTCEYYMKGVSDQNKTSNVFAVAVNPY
jgi:hypothetical protein